MYYRTGKQTICEARPFLIFSPKMLQAGAVKGLICMRIVYCHSFIHRLYWILLDDEKAPIKRYLCQCVCAFRDAFPKDILFFLLSFQFSTCACPDGVLKHSVAYITVTLFRCLVAQSASYVSWFMLNCPTWPTNCACDTNFYFPATMIIDTLYALSWCLHHPVRSSCDLYRFSKRLKRTLYLNRTIQNMCRLSVYVSFCWCLHSTTKVEKPTDK